jgi:hypothetical protein
VLPPRRDLSRRFGGTSVIMHMSLSTMLFLLVDVRDVGVFDRRVVVVMRMGGKQVHPVLTPMKVMGHVIVLMSMLDRLVLMTAVPLLHRRHLLPCGSARTESDDRTSPSEAPHHLRPTLATVRRVSDWAALP